MSAAFTQLCVHLKTSSRAIGANRKTFKNALPLRFLSHFPLPPMRIYYVAPDKLSTNQVGYVSTKKTFHGTVLNTVVAAMKLKPYHTSILVEHSPFVPRHNFSGVPRYVAGASTLTTPASEVMRSGRAKHLDSALTMRRFFLESHRKKNDEGKHVAGTLRPHVDARLETPVDVLRRRPTIPPRGLPRRHAKRNGFLNPHRYLCIPGNLSHTGHIIDSHCII